MPAMPIAALWPALKDGFRSSLTTSHLTYIGLALGPVALCALLMRLDLARPETALLISTLAALVTLSWLEAVAPRDAGSRLLQNRRELRLNLSFIPIIAFGVDLPLKVLSVLLLLPMLGAVGPRPGLDGWPVVLQIPFLLLLSNGLEYGWHRLMHSTRWGWRIHRVHHASRVFNWAIGPKVHLIDGLSIGLINLLPLMLFGVRAEVAVLTVATRIGFELLTHSNLQMNLSIWSRVFITPAHHVWHHSTRPEEANHNYSVWLLAYDQLFGTAWRPAARPQPGAYGLTGDETWLTTDAGLSTPRMVGRLLLSPLRARPPDCRAPADARP
jgi:sterol desaturase/sphingolipid hydroxylase (fatty acid hydroxylase superfamily)